MLSDLKRGIEYKYSHIFIHLLVKHLGHFQVHFPLDILHLFHTEIAFQLGQHDLVLRDDLLRFALILHFTIFL